MLHADQQVYVLKNTHGQGQGGPARGREARWLLSYYFPWDNHTGKDNANNAQAFREKSVVRWPFCLGPNFVP